MKRAEKLYEEQERRVDKFVRNCGGEGDLEITSIEGLFNLYGIVVKARMGRKPYSFPPCLIEPVEIGE